MLGGYVFIAAAHEMRQCTLRASLGARETATADTVGWITEQLWALAEIGDPNVRVDGAGSNPRAWSGGERRERRGTASEGPGLPAPRTRP